MQDLTPRDPGVLARAIVHAQSQTPQGARTTRPGVLPLQPQRPGSTNQADNNDDFTGGLDGLDGHDAPKLAPSFMQSGTAAAAASVKAGEMTAPGSQPAMPLPEAVAGEHLGPDPSNQAAGEPDPVPVNTPSKAPENAGIPDRVTKFARHTFSKVDGGSGPWGRVRQ